MPQSDAERREKLLAWSAVENHFITSGVPFSVLGTPVSAHRLQRGKALCNATGAPALIVNSFGKGRAWYFNFDLTKLGLLRNKNRHAAIMDLVRCIMLDAGVKPLAAVIGADGRIIEHCAVYAYHRKPIQYLGLLPAAEAMMASERPVRLLLPPDRTAYDVRARKMLDGARCGPFAGGSEVHCAASISRQGRFNPSPC